MNFRIAILLFSSEGAYELLLWLQLRAWPIPLNLQLDIVRYHYTTCFLLLFFHQMFIICSICSFILLFPLVHMQLDQLRTICIHLSKIYLIGCHLHLYVSIHCLWGYQTSVFSIISYSDTKYGREYLLMMDINLMGLVLNLSYLFFFGGRVGSFLL